MIWFLISTKTRIETQKSNEHEPLKDQYLISDFHQNKDWNIIVKIKKIILTWIWFLISTKTRIETVKAANGKFIIDVFDFWFPPKQGLKLHSDSLILMKIKIWFLISTKTRIETRNLTNILLVGERIWFLISTKTRIETLSGLRRSLFPFPNLISDFHQNKDWNHLPIHNPRGKLPIWFLISTKTRIETLESRVFLVVFVWFDFWFPPKQGLKPNMLNSTERTLDKFDFWFPPKQGLKLCKHWCISVYKTKFDFWFPPKQGLKLRFKS